MHFLQIDALCGLLYEKGKQNKRCAIMWQSIRDAIKAVKRLHTYAAKLASTHVFFEFKLLLLRTCLRSLPIYEHQLMFFSFVSLVGIHSRR